MRIIDALLRWYWLNLANLILLKSLAETDSSDGKYRFRCQTSQINNAWKISSMANHQMRCFTASLILSLMGTSALAGLKPIGELFYPNISSMNRIKLYVTEEEACRGGALEWEFFREYLLPYHTFSHVDKYSRGFDCIYKDDNNEPVIPFVGFSWPICPAHSQPGFVIGTSAEGCFCNNGLTYDFASNTCVAIDGAQPIDPGFPPEQPVACTAGAQTINPILPASAEKFRYETDFIDAGEFPLSFARIYRSSWGVKAKRQKSGAFGVAWTHNHAFALTKAPAVNPEYVTIVAPEGPIHTFTKAAGSSIWTSTGTADTLWQGSNGSWIYRKSETDAVLSFSAAGKLQSQTERNGWSTSYSYNAAGLLATIANSFGRTITLGYNSVGQLTTITLPDGRIVGYSYDAAGRLALVTYPDGKTRGFVYENTAFPSALTGLLDENGARWATFVYDKQGLAISSELAGGAEHFQVNYSVSGSTLVTDPLGTSRSYSYNASKGVLAVTENSLPSGMNESDAAKRIQDANGLITSETDFKGVTTTTVWDVARRLPTAVVRASNTPDSQAVTMQWHSTFSLPALITEAGRTTAYTYDSFGNVLAKTVTDTTTNKAQLWQWTYNAQQLVTTATEPNGATTRYTYDAQGNVLTSTNALGHVTTYTYDKANRIISQTEPNGLVTTYTYDLRDRLLTHTIAGRTTTLTYKPFGSVETVTLPIGLVLTYTYDAAHRLTGWRNNRGESGDFTLDGMGNRTAEQIKDSTGSVAWRVARTVNNINRISSKTEGSNQIHIFGYDANGEFVRRTNGLNQSIGYDLDALRRVKTVTDAANFSATLKYNAFDAVIEAKDSKGVVTSYARDAQGNATAESSADIGRSIIEYDSLGLPSKITNALKQATIITRDKLGRPLNLVFADGKSTTLSYDLTAASKGYLSKMVDRSGMTEYTRDGFGRVTLKKQTLANGAVQQISYGYNANGTLASIVYPNGSMLAHQYDSTGRLTGLILDGKPLVGNITWNPLGQPTGWTWAFTSSNPKLAASRSYDTAGRLTATEFSSYVYNAAGRIISLTQNQYKPADIDATRSTLTNANVTWNVGYDAVGRITSFIANGNGTSFGYDANGNRTSSVETVNNKSISRTYTVGVASNLLTGFKQTAGVANTSVNYRYNANGDLTSDGLRSYAYDAEGRLSSVTTGATDTSPTTRYAHNALGQRVFKTEPVFSPTKGDVRRPSFMQNLTGFFTKVWNPTAGGSAAERLGYAYVYDEEGTLIAEVGSGGANSAGTAQYIYLPTANGPMPIAAVINGTTYAVHSDHLNTPRKLTNADGQAVWQWGYSAFGEDKPTTAKNRFANLDITSNPGRTNLSEVKFNLRYPGQYADEESGLFYNGYRSYDSRTGRYSQGDPIGLRGGWNRFGYVNGNPLRYTDPSGLLAEIVGPAALGGGVLAAGCSLSQGCRKAMAEVAQSCQRAADWLKDRMFSDGQRPSKTPNTGDPGSTVVNPGSGQERGYGDDGLPAWDVAGISTMALIRLYRMGMTGAEMATVDLFVVAPFLYRVLGDQSNERKNEY